MIPDFRYLINFILLIIIDVFDLLCFEWSVKSLTDCKNIEKCGLVRVVLKSGPLLQPKSGLAKPGEVGEFLPWFQ